MIGGEPLYGIKTGYNPAYLLDTPTKESLIAADPASAGLFRPYLRGEDLDRWHAVGAGLWMLTLKSSGNHPWPWADLPDAEAEAVFRKTYPAVFAHCDAHRDKLSAREDQGRYWWELRACAYWDAFDRPKVPYTDISWRASFNLDTSGTMSNNTVYFLPTDDRWTLAVLNSPAAWWYSWRAAVHGKDEALRLFTSYLANFPVPDPSPAARERAEAIVARLIDLTAGRTSGLRALLDWLRVELGVERVSNKLSDLVGLTADELAAEVRQCRPKKAGLSSAELQRLRAEYTAGVVPLREQAAECRTLEQELAGLVNAAYGLTPSDVALMWQTAPPRMPTVAPKPH